MSNNPEEESPDRDLELEGDDGQGSAGHDLDLEDLPPAQRAEIQEQVEQIKREADEDPKVGH